MLRLILVRQFLQSSVLMLRLTFRERESTIGLMSNQESPGCLGALFLLFRNPLPGEEGSPYHPVGAHLKPEIPVKIGAPNSAWAASYERTAENMDDLGAHDIAARLRKKVEELDNGVELK